MIRISLRNTWEVRLELPKFEHEILHPWDLRVVNQTVNPTINTIDLEINANTKAAAGLVHNLFKKQFRDNLVDFREEF